MKRNRSISGVPAAFLAASLSLASCGSVLSDFAAVRESAVLGPASPTSPLTTVLQSLISAGNRHSLFADGNGAVWAWGYNAYGQLGNGTTVHQTTPAEVTGV